MKFPRICLAIALLTTTVGCQSDNGKTVPDTLVGVWKTSHPKYADRFIEIKKEFVIFGTGGESSTVHAIADVDRIHDGKNIYTITHLNHAGQRYSFSFYYDPSNDGTMRFRNQKDILWTREGR